MHSGKQRELKRAREVLAARGDESANELFARILLCQDLLEHICCFCSFKSVFTLIQLGRAFVDLLGGTKNENGWRMMCVMLAEQERLYLPPSYFDGWKQLFMEQLWPARHKWNVDKRVQQNFSIRVCARFRPEIRPGAKHAYNHDARFVLPLHQRINLIKKGKLDRKQLFEQSQDHSLLQALAGSDELPPEVLEALMEARQLKLQSKNATEHWTGTWDASVDEGNDGGPLGGGVMNANQAGGGGAAGPGLQWNDRATEGNEEDIVEEDLPASEQAKKARHARVLAVQSSRVLLHIAGQGVRAFLFTHVFNQATSQPMVYERGARDSVVACLNGFNACLICYGQTGSGKTFTIYGPEGVLDNLKSEASRNSFIPRNMLRENPSVGVALRTFAELLAAKTQQSKHGVVVNISMQYVQLYQGSATDLLTGAPVQIRDSVGQGSRSHGHQHPLLTGASEENVQDLFEVVSLLGQGEERKRYAATAMNQRSSRAHTILIIKVAQVNVATKSSVASFLHLVDLAGCEQVKMSRVVGQQLKEAVGINSSLLVLGKVINGLVEGASHIPYLESRLTVLLRAALGGNSRTTVVVTCSSEPDDGAQAMHALQFGERCASVHNQNEVGAMSVDDALTQVMQALRVCRHSMNTLPIGDPSRERLKLRFQQLESKRIDLVQFLQQSQLDAGAAEEYMYLE